MGPLNCYQKCLQTSSHIASKLLTYENITFIKQGSSKISTLLNKKSTQIFILFCKPETDFLRYFLQQRYNNSTRSFRVRICYITIDNKSSTYAYENSRPYTSFVSFQLKIRQLSGLSGHRMTIRFLIQTPLFDFYYG